MQYVTDIHSYQSGKRSAVTLGKFDGFHLGHQKLIHKIKEYASGDIKSIVCAFDMGRDSILTEKERIKKLEGQVDCLITCPFTREIRQMEAETFIKSILVDTFHAAYIVVGTDFCFGHEKRGNVKMLARYAEVYGYHLDIIEKERYENRVISSSYIREALSEGNVRLAGELLGSPYSITGRVEHGKQLGRTLGFPTMNVAPDERKLVPRFGVYACRIFFDGVWYEGIGNVGVKPTVSEEPKLLVEVYVFDFKGNTYGKEITIEFASFERPEQKFYSVAELKHQVDCDIQFGKDFFEKC